MDNRPIGIFDSGIGGLTLASAIERLMPNEQIIYFGDTAHLPYGDKSEESIITYSTRIASFLSEKGCKAMLIACNTASSVSSAAVKGSVTFPVYNVIDPVISAVIEKFQGKKVGVIGTKGTIGSKIYGTKLNSSDPTMHVVEKATTLLATMIEEGFHNDSISEAVIQAYLEDTQFIDLQAIVPACTHYPLISDQINKFFKGSVEVVDAPTIVAESIRNDLDSRALLSNERSGRHLFFVSDHTEAFERSTKIFFGEELELEEHRFPAQ